MVRDVAAELTLTYGKKLMVFLDYHGHSTRKNAFLLGPGLLDARLISDIRIFPRIIADRTELFRYPSCSFRTDPTKKTTARVLLSRAAGLAYTLEVSNWAYYAQSTADVYYFTVNIL
jgi:hypothetical protein